MVAGVAITPTLPRSLIAAAISASGPIGAGRCRRVAGDDQELGATIEQEGGVALDQLAQPRDRLRPVGEVGAVAEVEEALLRQGDEALVQNGEAADPGIEDGYRE